MELSDFALLIGAIAWALSFLGMHLVFRRQRRADRRRAINELICGPPLSITADYRCPHCRASLRQSGGSRSGTDLGKYATAQELEGLR